MKLKPSAQSSTKNENFDNTTETLLKTRYRTFSVVRHVTWNLKFAWNISPMIAE